MFFCNHKHHGGQEPQDEFLGFTISFHFLFDSQMSAQKVYLEGLIPLLWDILLSSHERYMFYGYVLLLFHRLKYPFSGFCYPMGGDLNRRALNYVFGSRLGFGIQDRWQTGFGGVGLDFIV